MEYWRPPFVLFGKRKSTFKVGMFDGMTEYFFKFK